MTDKNKISLTTHILILILFFGTAILSHHYDYMAAIIFAVGFFIFASSPKWFEKIIKFIAGVK